VTRPAGTGPARTGRGTVGPAGTDRTGTRGRAPRWAVYSSLALSLAGLAVAGYLTLEHLTASVTLACPDTGVINCRKVTSSEQSSLFGVPLPVLGGLFFLTMTALCLPSAWRLAVPAVPWIRLGLATSGVLFVLYLVYAELFILDAICLWCTVVHVLAFALFVVLALAAAVAPARVTGN